MDINNDDLYLSELQTQCRFALRALTYVQFSINEDDIDTDEIWYHIQMFLVSIANVSKMLKSNKDNSINFEAHHQRIVTEYNLPENYFTNEKRMRNRFEHYDERLLKWLNKPSQIRGLNNIGPVDGFISGVKFNYLKHFDPTTHTLHFDDLTVNLQDAYEQLNILNQKLEETLFRNPQRS